MLPPPLRVFPRESKWISLSRLFHVTTQMSPFSLTFPDRPAYSSTSPVPQNSSSSRDSLSPKTSSHLARSTSYLVMVCAARVPLLDDEPCGCRDCTWAVLRGLPSPGEYCLARRHSIFIK